MNGQREEIESERLIKDRIRRWRRWLIQIKSKLTPAVFHAQAKGDADDNREYPDDRTEQARRVDVDGLIVDHNRAAFERARRKRSLKQPERAAQDNDGQNSKDEK